MERAPLSLDKKMSFVSMVAVVVVVVVAVGLFRAHEVFLLPLWHLCPNLQQQQRACLFGGVKVLILRDDRGSRVRQVAFRASSSPHVPCER